MASKPYDFAVDIDMLEKEISASEQNKMPDALKGNIGANYDASAKAEGSSHMSTDQTHGEPGSDGEFNTLDEPIWTTASRDLKVIRGKFRQLLLPSSDNQQSSRDWDLWGPSSSASCCRYCSEVVQRKVLSSPPSSPWPSSDAAW